MTQHSALTVLVTGFGPFPGAPLNPTGALAHKLTRLRRPALALVARFDTLGPTVDD